MKEILQLFRRDAENAPPKLGTEQYDLSMKPRILKESSVGSGSGQSSREASVLVTGERRVTPPVERKAPAPREDALYGRRW
jgi:hypothetical protein